MATKIRLQRNGRKNYAFYRVVIADSRAPRDGKFIEMIGTYNPNTNPSTIELNFERALYWVQTGAQPTETVHSILSKEGVYLMKHLLGGVKKGAFDEATANAKFEAWKQDKQNGLNALLDAQRKAKQEADAKAIAAEKKINAEIAKKVAEKNAVAEPEVAETEETETAEAVEEVAVEAETAETPVVEAAEEVVAEAEAPAEIAEPTEPAAEA